MRFEHIVITASMIVASVSTAQEPPASGLSVEGDLFAPAPGDFTVCWSRPTRMPRSGVARFGRALEAAGRSTQPPHVSAAFERRSPTATEGCELSLRSVVGRKVLANDRRRIQIKVTDAAGAPVLTELAGPLLPARVREEDLLALWRKLWPRVAPPPPAPAAPTTAPTASAPIASAPAASAPADATAPPNPDGATPAPGSTPFVDPDLARAKADLEAQDATPPRPPILTLALHTGLLSRSLDADGGRPQDQSALFSLGGQARLHVHGITGWSEDRLDVSVAYWRQLVQAEIDGSSFGAESDRTRASARYGRAWFGPWGPTLGPMAGFEFRRFTFEPTATTLSLQYSVLRPGVWAEQPLVDLGTRGRLLLTAAGGVRVPLGGDDADFDAGFDVEGALAYQHSSGFRASIDIGYTRQSGSADDIGFTDEFVDASLGLGWSL
jgi:hypothetical protein